MKKTSSDPRIDERLSRYAGEQKQIQDRLAQVARPPQTDPAITARLRRYTR